MSYQEEIIDPRVDTHILVVGFQQKQGKVTGSEKGVYLAKAAAQTQRLIKEQNRRCQDVSIRCVAYNIACPTYNIE